MINMFTVPYVPGYCEWVYKRGTAKPVIAISDKDSPTIYLYDASGEEATRLITTLSFSKFPVKILKYNEPFDTVVSIDTSGMIEYWDGTTFEWPQVVKFQYKTETDLYDFAKKKTVATSLAFSSNGLLFACMGKDRQVRVFHFLTGKLYRKYNESLNVFTELQKEEGSTYKLDPIDFGRRMAVERELGNADNEGKVPPSNVIFDESGNFILYPTLLGIKLVNLVTNKLIRIIGKIESTERFLAISLYQGKSLGPVGTTERKYDAQNDPTLFCASFKKPSFYLFSRREPEEPEEGDNTLTGGRDVFNERPTADQTSMVTQPAKHSLGTMATIHTTLGDIHIKLFPNECPKTVENFVTHSKNGYYNGVIFHRVIKGFMIQTGDPLGDGTGGTSIWETEFEDEFHRSLRHDRPFTVSMANHGPNTNGSQFFITTVPIPRLDNIHTVFGRVTKGMDVALSIEKVKTDRNDKPLKDIKILGIKILSN